MRIGEWGYIRKHCMLFSLDVIAEDVDIIHENRECFTFSLVLISIYSV